MAIKELMTRIALKYDSYSAWTTAPGKDLVLLAGELGICYIGDANQGSNVVPTVLFKVGDGTSTFEQLPWASAKAADVYNWAKASEVKRDGKKLVFVGGIVNADGSRSNLEVAFDYVTLAEVQAITNGLDSRIATLEEKFTGTGSVQGQLDALDGRLDVIEGSGDGSVAKALVDAKAYTDTREAAIETAYKAYADQAEADAKSYADAEFVKDRAAIAAVEDDIETINGDATKEGSFRKAVADAVTEVKTYADTAESDAVATAKDYTDDREVEINKAIAQAKTDANSYTDTQLSAAVTTIETKDSAQDDEIAKKLDTATYTAYIAGKSMSDEDLKAYADGKASAAQSAAETNAATTAQNKVDALANGAVAANTSAIEAMDAAYKDADTAIKGRLDTVEGKLANVTNVMDFRGAVAELPASTEGYQNGDVIVVTEGNNKGKEYVVSDGAFVEFGNTDANAAAITSLQGRMTTAEGDIDALETRANNLEAADTAIDERLDVIEGEGAGSIKKAQADAEANAKSYTDGRETAIRSELKSAYEAYADKAEEDAVATANAYTDAEVKKLQSADATLEAGVKSLQDIVDGYTAKSSIKTAVDAAQKAADDAQTAADNAQDAADKAQGEIDALELVVGNETTGLAATKVIADRADAKSEDNADRLDTAEGKITTLQGIVETGANSNANLRSAITDLQTLTGENGTIRSEIAAAQKAGDDAAAAVDALSKGQVATNKSNIAKLDGRVTAIEEDYVKASDLVGDFYIFNCGTSTTVTHVAPKAE